MWRSDGTECGTFRFAVGPHGPSPIESIGADLIFGAYHYATEREIYKLPTSAFPASPCTTTIASTDDIEVLDAEGNEIVSHYPNPFNDQLTLRIAGESDELARVQVFASDGAPVEQLDNIACNTDHSIGSTWNSGMYILKVNTKAGMQVRKVLKK